MIHIKEISTLDQAATIAPLYRTYYKRASLTEDTFLDRWQRAHQNPAYHMVAAYTSDDDNPQGFMDFSIIPSIFWEPCLARIDSIYVHDSLLEKEIADALFDHSLQIMQAHSISKVIAVSCANYAQEVRILSRKLQLDNDPSKTAFLGMVDKDTRR